MKKRLAGGGETRAHIAHENKKHAQGVHGSEVGTYFLIEKLGV